MGKKECRGTLFIAYFKQAMGPNKGSVHYYTLLIVFPIYMGDKECTPTLFVAYNIVEAMWQ